MAPGIEVTFAEVLLVIAGVVLLATVPLLLGPVMVGAAIGRLLPGASARTGADVSLRAGLAALIIFSAIGAVLEVGLPYSLNFHGFSDAWHLALHPVGWIS